MKKTISALAVTLVAVASQFGAPPVQAGHGRGLGLGLGILGGVAAAVIISDAARAEGRRRGPYCSRFLISVTTARTGPAVASTTAANEPTRLQVTFSRVWLLVG